MYELDFLPVEADDGPSSKSGDAITARFTPLHWVRPAVLVVDAGFNRTGQDVISHINDWYDTDRVDLMISTHPDSDHLNGLQTIVEQLTVDKLLIHNPRNHHAGADEIGNIERVDNLIAAARKAGTEVLEPFAGQSYLNGAVTILGPSLLYYQQLLAEQVEEVRSGAAARAQLAKMLAAGAKHAEFDLIRLYASAIASLPDETLDDEGETSPRNRSSVITLLQVDDERLLLTGDAGIDSLEQAADQYEQDIGSFGTAPLNLFQAPHHGSRRNLGPSILDRILGQQGAAYRSTVSVISSAKADLKHPHPQVTNALRRRDCVPTATEGRTLLESNGGRAGWGPAEPVPVITREDLE